MGIHVEFVGNLFVDGREDSGRPRWRKTTPGAGIFEVEVHSCVRLEKVKTHQLAESSQLKEGEVFPTER